MRVDALCREIARAELGCHELAARHRTRTGAIADLTHERDAGSNLAQLGEVAFELDTDADTKLAGQRTVALLDVRENALVAAGQRGREQCIESVGNAAERRMHHQPARARREPRTHDAGDVAPI